MKTRVDPEEAFVASLSSCHMLTFLAICARKRITVESYEDEAVGYLEKGEDGRQWMARVVLRPRIRFAPDCEVDVAALAAHPPRFARTLLHRQFREDGCVRGVAGLRPHR